MDWSHNTTSASNNVEHPSPCSPAVVPYRVCEGLAIYLAYALTKKELSCFHLFEHKLPIWEA